MRKRLFLLLIFPFFLLTCGIEKYYYLPQLSQSNVNILQELYRTEIKIPSILANADFVDLDANYMIFYKIYTGDKGVSTQTEAREVNPILKSDFQAFESHVDPTVTTSQITTSTFTGRNYYELQFDQTNITNIITRNGGTFIINFSPIPGDIPNIEVQGKDVSNLLRNDGKEGGVNEATFTPLPEDRLFFFSPEFISETDHSTEKINNDVFLRSSDTNKTDSHAYISMYIVATGQNPINFTRIFSKPTHLGVYKLPNR